MDAESYNHLVGKRIRRIRKSAGLSQTALAERLDQKQSTISALERGERGIKVELVYGICAELGVSPTRLLPPMHGGDTLTPLAIADQLEKVVDWIHGESVEWEPTDPESLRVRAVQARDGGQDEASGQ